LSAFILSIGAAVDLAAWKSGDLTAKSPGVFPKRRGVVFDLAGDDTVTVPENFPAGQRFAWDGFRP